MKQFLFIFLLAAILIVQTNPEVGEKFNIKYDPSEKNIFSLDDKLTLVYVFDYWNIGKSLNGKSKALFQNVLYPINEKVTKIEMEKEGNLDLGESKIPDDVY